MTKQQELKISLSIVLMVLVTTGGVVGAHFMGIASAESKSKDYTERKIKDVRLELNDKLNNIHRSVIQNGNAIIKLETKMEL